MKEEKKKIKQKPGENVTITKSAMGNRIENISGNDDGVIEQKPGENIQITKTGKGNIIEKLDLSEASIPEQFKAEQRSIEEAKMLAMPTQQEQLEEEEVTPKIEQPIQNEEQPKEKGKFMQAVDRGDVAIALGIGILALVTGGIAAGAFGGGAAAAGAGTGAAKVAASTAGRGVITQTLMAGGKRAVAQRAISATPALSKVGKLFEVSKVTAAQNALKGLGLNQVKSILTPKKLIVGAIGTDAMMAWLASDNIMSGVSIHARDLGYNVRQGIITKEEALSQLDDLQAWKNRAERFVKISSKLNPILMPFGRIMMTNAHKSQADLDLQKQIIYRV